jgi:hypothetical protein
MHMLWLTRPEDVYLTSVLGVGEQIERLITGNSVALIYPPGALYLFPTAGG